MTSAFLHYGILHIGVNMWALWSGGALVERLFGNAFFAIVYLFSALTGSLASIAWRHQAISAGTRRDLRRFCALLAYLLVRRESLPQSILKPLIGNTLAFVGYNIAFGLVSSMTDNAAHIGGLAGGFVLGAIMARPLEMQRRKRQLLPRLAAGLLIGAAAIGVWIQRLPKAPPGVWAVEQLVFWFRTEADQLNRRLDSLVSRLDSRSITRGDLAVQLDKQVIPGWQAAMARLERTSRDNSSPMVRGAADDYLRYATLRRSAGIALSDWAKSGDAKKLAVYQKARAEGDRMWGGAKQPRGR